jgi:SNF2 family DNA or RNA helicase
MRHLQAVPRCALWMPMGGGKTVSVLSALRELSVVEDVFPVLVLAPLRVAKSVWPEEIEKWAHLNSLRIVAVTGSVAQKRRAMAQPADIVAVNYDNLQWFVEQFGDAFPFRTIVADESTRLKSYRIKQGGKRAAALGRVAHMPSVRRFIELTGTPSPNGLPNLWGQIWFLDQGERLGRTYSAFENRWFRTGYDGHGLEPFEHTEREITERLRDLCLTVEGMPVDQPIVNDIIIDLPPSARSLYRTLERDMFARLESADTINAVHAAALTMKCRQVASGAVYVNDTKEWREVHRAKIDALASIIEEANGAPVLIAYEFASDLARLKNAFPDARVLDSNPRTISDWNKGLISKLLAHPKSAGHGINLADGGNILAFFSMSWNLEEYLQIIERIGPMRQAQAGLDRPTFVHRILARSTIDGAMVERMSGKKSVQDILLAAMRARRKA